jgi:hypothetical protein
MSDRSIPVYFPYVTHDRKQRLLIGKTNAEWQEGGLLLRIEFDEEVWLLDEGKISVCLVYGERAERVFIGEVDFTSHGHKTESVLKFDRDSGVVRMLPMARSFALGF